MPQSLRKHMKIIIQNINPNIITVDLTNIREENTQEKVHIKRFQSSYNHQPLPIVCLTCKDTLCHKLSSEGITTRNYLQGITTTTRNYLQQKINKITITK